jgi:hypothetical protein
MCGEPLHGDVHIKRGFVFASDSGEGSDHRARIPGERSGVGVGSELMLSR